MTKAERWANDYLNLHQNELVSKYGLKAEWGESVLAAMFEKYASECVTKNLCPECEYEKEVARIRRETAVEMAKAYKMAKAYINEDNKTRFDGGFGPRIDKSADVAQRPEQGFCKPQVGGSNPSVGSTIPSWSVSPTMAQGPEFAPREEPRNRRAFARFIDIWRIALGPKGESVNGKPAASKAVTAGSSPASPAKCQQDPFCCKDYAGGCSCPTAADLGCHSKTDLKISNPDCDCFSMGRHNCPVHADLPGTYDNLWGV